MKKYKLLGNIVLAIFTMAIVTRPAMCRTLSAQVSANSSFVDAKLEAGFETYQAKVKTSAEIAYNDDNYLIARLGILLHDSVFTPALDLGLGFKGAYGNAEIGSKDFDLAAFGFLVTGEYDFRKDYRRLPLSLVAEITAAPESLCFADTKQYIDFSMTAYGYIVHNAALFLGYRNIDAKFEYGRGEAKKREDSIFFGARLNF